MDYFTKWIKVEALATITKRKMKSFLWKSIVCKFGMPHLIIIENGTQFQEKFKGFYTDLHIVLAMNKKILTALKKKVEKLRVHG